MKSQFLIASDYSTTSSAAAASGILGFTGILLILLVIYGIIFFLLPIFVYRIMRRGTESCQRLGEIRDLLRKQAALSKPRHVEQLRKAVIGLDLSPAIEILEHERALSTLD